MKILIIEDDKFYSRNLKKAIQKQFNYETVDTAFSRQELEEKDINSYDLIISDIFMQDYDEEYIQTHLIPLKKPIILITGFPDKVLKEKLSKLNIVDFIVKTESNQFNHIINKIQILEYLKNKPILIVDDSKTALLINMKLIKKCYPFTDILTATNGEEALQKISEHKNIKLILTDYEMPKMNGLQLIRNIRKEYNIDDKIIIAISSVSEKHISSTLLKIGANDFLHKPFVEEELMCRIDNNIKNAILIDEIKEMVFKDPLTNIYNRRYFFDVAQKMFLTAKRTDKEVSVIMCDIDHFKQINDTYGHQSGDLVIIKTAEILKNSVRKNDIVCRYGGEEFVILLYDCPSKFALLIAEKIRKAIENVEIIDDNDKKITYTLSLGVTNKGNTLEEMIKNSDEMLYKAKEVRNKVVVDK
jgi:diguanylate cyclase (GGDEF)-like protein